MKIKKMIFKGFGFPIILKNVPAHKVRGKHEPNINYKKLAKKTVMKICSEANNSPLTGNQICFLRHYLEMTTGEFAEFSDASSVEVKKWENKEDAPTQMTPSLEKMLRLKILIRLGVTPARFYEIFKCLKIKKRSRLIQS